MRDDAQYAGLRSRRGGRQRMGGGPGRGRRGLGTVFRTCRAADGAPAVARGPRHHRHHRPSASAPRGRKCTFRPGRLRRSRRKRASAAARPWSRRSPREPSYLGAPAAPSSATGSSRSDQDEARTLVMRLVDDLGLRGLDEGRCQCGRSRAMTHVLLHLYRRYGSRPGSLRRSELKARECPTAGRS